MTRRPKIHRERLGDSYRRHLRGLYDQPRSNSVNRSQGTRFRRDRFPEPKQSRNITRYGFCFCAGAVPEMVSRNLREASSSAVDASRQQRTLSTSLPNWPPAPGLAISFAQVSLRPVTGTSNVGLWERTLGATDASYPLAAPRDATANLIHRKDLGPSICIMAAVDRRTFAMWSGD